MKKKIEKTGEKIERDYFNKVVRLLYGFKNQRDFLFNEIRTLSQKANYGETINGRLDGTLSDIEDDIKSFDFELKTLLPGFPEEDIPF